MVTHNKTIDAVLLEVLGSALASIVDEMGETLIRAAYSPNIKERRDLTAGILNTNAKLIAQADHNPAHLASLYGIVGEIVQRYPLEDIKEGDEFIGNDPHTSGGAHLPDILLASPVHIDGKIVAWVGNVAHHADFGDRTHAHIFQEGLRIPPVRILRAGELQNDLFELILLNCQLPDQRRADFRAQLAANRLGRTRYLELVDRYGVGVLSDAADALLDYTERKTRAAIRAVPDGTYQFTDRFDCPELDEELDLRVSIEVSGDELTVDFSGNPDQVRASVNMVWSALQAAVFYSMKTLLDPDIVPNAGLERPIHIVAPAGSILNAVAPAAVNGRSETSQRVVDLIHGALASALPERVTAASNGANTGVHFSGVDSRTGKYFIYLETIGGGSGARATKDGLDGVQVHLTNTSNLPVECLEAEYPLFIEAYELVDDSGGPGKYRGGLGIRRRVRVEEDDVYFWLDTSRQRSRPWGLFGGLPGDSARFPMHPSSRQIDHGAAVLHRGDSVELITAGAGGYGSPTERDPALLARDVKEGKVSAVTARDVYGIEPSTLATAAQAPGAHRGADAPGRDRARRRGKPSQVPGTTHQSKQE
jgi:N-methylhydantoinase B